jgi:integrase
MGTIQKRDDNAGVSTYQVKIRRKGHPVQSRTFMSRADAKRWEHEVESEISRGVFVNTTAARRHTLRDVLKKYREEVTPRKKGKANEEIILKSLERDQMAAYAVANLTSGIVGNWRDRRLAGADGRPVTGSTVNRQMNLLHHVLEVARKEWGIGTPVNPVSDVSRPRSNPARSRRLSPVEQVALLAACSKSRAKYLRPITELALETAMRLGEIVNLEWEQVDLEDRVIHLRAGATKNDEQRGVPLSSRAVEVLDGIPGDRKGRVWPGLESAAATRAFIRIRIRSGVPDFRFHDTRHEATSRFVELGLTDSEVMSVTGHKTHSMMRRYTHLSAKNLAKKLDLLTPANRRAAELSEQLRGQIEKAAKLSPDMNMPNNDDDPYDDDSAAATPV